MNPFERNAFDYSSFGKAFMAPIETANPCVAAMQQWSGAMTRASLEVAGFWSRRSRAGLDAPRQYAACRNFQDVASLNAELATVAMRDWANTAQRTMAIMAAPARPPRDAERPTRTTSGNGSSSRRPETAPPAQAPAPAPASLRSERPAEPRPPAPASVATSPVGAYEWWRTDMKAIVPRRNGHAGHGSDGRRPL